MPNVEVELPTGIGDTVLIYAGALAGQVAMVIAWRVLRPRFLLGGSLDRAPQLSLMIITDEGEDCWLGEGEVTYLGAPVVVPFCLPFTGGDLVQVQSSGARGEVVGWEIIGRRLGVEVTYRVRLDGAPFGEEVEVDVRGLALRTGEGTRYRPRRLLMCGQTTGRFRT